MSLDEIIAELVNSVSSTSIDLSSAEYGTSIPKPIPTFGGVKSKPIQNAFISTADGGARQPPFVCIHLQNVGS